MSAQFNADLSNVSEDDWAKWNLLIDKVQQVMEEVFDVDNDKPCLVVGVQFGDMGRDEDQPTCLVTSNLPECVLPGVLADMGHFAEHQHMAYHAEHSVQEVVDASAVPEEVIAKIREMFGDIDLSQVRFIQTADISDLEGAEGIEGLTGVEEVEEQ